MPCSVCLFDASVWSKSDLERTLDAFAPWFGQLMEGARPDVVEAMTPLAAKIAGLPRSVVDPEAVHQGWAAVAEAGRLRHAMGDGAPTAEGAVVQVSSSRGGVPKQPVTAGIVTSGGMVGDRQANRIHHGRPWQAICLWSADVIDALAAEGHPIGYGSAGENLTLRGIDWRTVRPGVRIAVGEALLETTPYAIPCQKNARWFSDGRFRRMAHEVAPGTSRIYARVLVEGSVAAGDPAVVEPVGVPVQRQPDPLRRPAAH